MDNLKKYLQQHKEAMDVDEPAAGTWKQIEKAGTQKKRSKLVALTIKLAAAAAVLIAVLVGIKFSSNKKGALVATREDSVITAPGKNSIDSGEPEIPSVASTNKATNILPPHKALPRKIRKADERYAMMQSFKENYSQLVSYQLSSIRSTAVFAENPAYFDDFKNRLKQMDMDEVAIRNIIRHQGISNSLLEQLINVYQQKLDVLKSLQAEINKMNERVKQQPAADSLNKYYLSI